MMKKNALATCCDSVLVSTRLFLRGCALALAWFWVFPFLCWVDPGLVAHTVLVASRCCCLWVSRAWKSNSEVFLRNSNFKQTPNTNVKFTLPLLGWKSSPVL